MNCLRCHRPLVPAPAPTKTDGAPRFVGFIACPCSRTAWLDRRLDGESYPDYLERINLEDPPPKPRSNGRRPHEARGSAASNSCLGAP